MSTMPHEAALPSPRAILTSMFNALPQAAPPPQPGHSHSSKTTATDNPLRALPPTHRSLLITLHVLFPSIFLHALDLLDRGLVTRVIQVQPSASLPPTPPAKPRQTHECVSDPGEGRCVHGIRENDGGGNNGFYLVRSAQSAHPQPRNASASSSRYCTTQEHGLSYIVRLEAWNCSCAAFAFSAFPGAASAPFSPVLELDNQDISSARPKMDDGEERRWEFGNSSFDGKENAPESVHVPCCKHLMACVLAQRWEMVLGRYVTEVRVGRNEMAGLGIDGVI